MSEEEDEGSTARRLLLYDVEKAVSWPAVEGQTLVSVAVACRSVLRWRW